MAIAVKYLRAVVQKIGEISALARKKQNLRRATSRFSIDNVELVPETEDDRTVRYLSGAHFRYLGGRVTLRRSFGDFERFQVDIYAFVIRELPNHRSLLHPCDRGNGHGKAEKRRHGDSPKLGSRSVRGARDHSMDLVKQSLERQHDPAAVREERSADQPHQSLPAVPCAGPVGPRWEVGAFH